MNPRRFATVAAAFCGSVGLAGWVVASLAGVGYAPQATAMGHAAVANADVVTAAGSVTGTAIDTTAASGEPESIVEAALPGSSKMLPPETPPVQVATASTPDPAPNDAKEAVSSIEILDECLAADICIDRYLWRSTNGRPKWTPSRCMSGGKWQSRRSAKR